MMLMMMMVRTDSSCRCYRFPETLRRSWEVTQRYVTAENQGSAGHLQLVLNRDGAHPKMTFFRQGTDAQ